MASIDKMLNKFFHSSLLEFFEKEKELIISGVHERSLCGKLAMYLQANIEKYGLCAYYVDIEYNRNQGRKIKTILDDDFKEITVICDIIVHSRGKNIQQDNLLAIEMKKRGASHKDKNNDRDRLRALTKDTYNEDVWSYDGKTLPEHVCGYISGVFIDINPKDCSCFLEEYRKGEKINEIKLKF